MTPDPVVPEPASGSRVSFRMGPRPRALGGFIVGAAFLVPAVSHAVSGLFWFLFKVSGLIYLLIWFRGTFPRFRYDQLMNIGWKLAIPVGMAAVLINALLGMIP